MRFRGLVYRVHNPQWSWTPLFGEGARRHGGRFNRRGVPALYTSLSPLTAIREAEPLGRPMQPLVLCAYEIDAEPIFDALDEELCQASHVGASVLACSAWEAEMRAGYVSASQALADRLGAACYAGMRVQSFARGAVDGDVNLVLRRWGANRPVRVVLIDDEDRLGRG